MYNDKYLEPLEDCGKELKNFRTNYLQMLDRREHYRKIRIKLIELPANHSFCNSMIGTEGIHHLMVRGCESIMDELETKAIKIKEDFYKDYSVVELVDKSEESKHMGFNKEPLQLYPLSALTDGKKKELRKLANIKMTDLITMLNGDYGWFSIKECKIVTDKLREWGYDVDQMFEQGKAVLKGSI